MDPLRLCLAFGPVAVYLLLMGALNLSRRAFIVSGTRDAAALGLAVSGFVLVGPISLFLPEAAAMHFRSYIVWGLLISCYGLTLTLILLMMRPRLVIYNISVDQLRPILAEVVDILDADGRWAGDSLVLPGLGVQLHLDQWFWTRNVSLVSSGSNQDYAGWRRLESALAGALARADVGRNPVGVALLGMGVFLVGLLAWAIYGDPQAIARTLFDVLGL
jgi:hypothetical protein